MSRSRSLLTAFAIIGGIRLWMQIRGTTKTPFTSWAIGYGALFVMLSLAAEAYPPAAGALAGTIVVGDLLVNGSSLFEDISSAITGAEKGQSILDPTPFSASTSGTASAKTVADGALPTYAHIPKDLAAPRGAVTGLPSPINGFTPSGS